MSNTILGSNLIKFFVDLGTGVTNVTNEIIKFAGSFSTLGAIGGGLLGTKGFGVFSAQNNKFTIFKKTLNDIKRDFLTGKGISSVFSSSLSQTDIGSIEQYTTLLKQGVPTGQAWEQTMKFCSVAAKQNVLQCKNNVTALEQMTVAQKASTSASKAGAIALKGLAIAGNMIAFFAIAKGIELVAKAIDDYVHRLDNAKEALASTESDLSSVKSEIETTTDRIKELEAMDSLSITDKEDLQRLKDQNEELRIRQQYLEKQKQSDAEKVANFTKEKYTSQYTSKSGNIQDDIDKYRSLYGQSQTQTSYASTSVSSGIPGSMSYAPGATANEYNIESASLSNLIAQYQYYQEEKAKAIAANDEASIEKYNAKLKETDQKLMDNRKTLQGFSDDLAGEASPELDGISEKLKLIDDLLLTPSQNLTNFINSNVIKEDKESLIALADSGKLTANVLSSSFSNVDDYLKKNKLTIKDLISVIKTHKDELETTGEAISKSLSKEEVISSVNSLSEGFESLDKIMSSMKDKNPFNYALLDDKKFKDNFDDLGEVYTNFIETVSSSPKDIKGAQSAFDDLTTAFVDNKFALNGYTEENAKLITSMLQNMGVANAEEFVMSRLTIAQEQLAAQKAYTVEMSDTLANAIASEIPGLINEATQSDIAKVALAGLALEKANANGTTLDTSGDIENVISLIGVIGTATTALNAYNRIKAGDIFDSETQKSNRDKLFSQTTGLGLSKELDKQFEAYEDISNRAKSAADKEIQDAIKASQNYKGKGTNINALYDGVKANKAGGSGKEKNKKDFKNDVDWINILIEQSQKKVDKLQEKINDTSNWKPKNALSDTAIAEMAKQIEGLQTQADAYQAKADSLDLSPSYIDKIKNGTLEIETITDEVISNNVKDYQEWYNKGEDVRKKIDETKKAMKELAQSKLDNIINDFDSLVSLVDKYSSYNKSLIQLQEDLGNTISSVDYNRLISQQEDIYSQLQSKYNALSKELSNAINSGAIEVGTDEWRKYREELIAVNSEMNETVSSMNEFRKSIIDLSFSELEKFSDTTDRINNGISTMIDLIGNEGLMKDGMITSKGLAQIALYGQQYSKAKQQAAEYGNAIEVLNEMYENGSLTQAEYNEKLNEYTSSQLSAVKATKDAQDAILQFRYDAIQAQIDDMMKLIDAKKKALQAEKDYQDYIDEINGKQKDIANLQKKIDELSLSGESDRKAYAQKLQLEDDLRKAKEELAKTQADYAFDKTIESLDKQGEEYEKSKNEELETLKSNTDAQEKVIKDYLGQVKDNYKTVYNTLTQYGTDYNNTMTNELTSPWDSAGSAVETFQSAVSDAIAQINIDIANIDLSKLTEMVSTMSGFSGSGASFEDVTGSGTWQKTSKGWWYGNSNDDYVSDGVYTIGGKQYNFNEDGYMKSGWDQSTGQWRYFEPENGQMVKSTWRKGADGKEYYLKSDGTMATDMAIKSKSENGYYYVNGDGVPEGGLISYDDVKKRKLTVGYKNGTKNSIPGLKKVNEEGPELIVTGNGTVLNSVGHDTIFNKEMTDKLWNMSIDPSKFILANLPKFDSSKLGTVNKSNVSLQIDSPLMVIQGNADEKVLAQMNTRLETFINKDIPQKMMEMSKQR